MFQRIIVPLDGSKGAERAILVAARLARTSGGSLVLVRVVLPPVELGKFVTPHTAVWERQAYEIGRAQAASYLAGAMLIHANSLAGIETDLVVATGLAAPTICASARLEHADLIVMYSHGETGLMRWMFGSVAQETARCTPVPVLLLQGRGAALPASHTADPLRVIVVLDGSPMAEVALSPAIELLAALAAPARAVLHLVHVVDLPATYGRWRSQAHVSTMLQEQGGQEAEAYLKAVASRLQAEIPTSLKLSVTTSVALGTDVADTEFRSAEYSSNSGWSGGCTLIALATGKRGALRRILAPDVCEKILGSTRFPLLVVRPHEVVAHSSAKGSNAASR
ncbi:MAG: universal stress protein [Ktedonobacteraceae bacterium]